MAASREFIDKIYEGAVLLSSTLVASEKALIEVNNVLTKIGQAHQTAHHLIQQLDALRNALAPAPHRVEDGAIVKKDPYEPLFHEVPALPQVAPTPTPTPHAAEHESVLSGLDRARNAVSQVTEALARRTEESKSQAPQKAAPTPQPTQVTPESKRKASELIFSKEQLTTLFQNDSGILRQFLSINAVDGGKGLIQPGYTGVSGHEFKHYQEDLAKIGNETLINFPTGFYTNSQTNGLQFLIQLPGRTVLSFDLGLAAGGLTSIGRLAPPYVRTPINEHMQEIEMLEVARLLTAELRHHLGIKPEQGSII